MPFVKLLVVSDSITGPARPPPTVKVTPSESPTFASLLFFALIELSFEKLKEDPFSMVAELSDPGGSRKTKSGISGPAVTKVCVPSATPPNRIPSFL